MTTNNQTKKFFIYARKSTDSEDRQVRSIADQLAELRELAKKEKLMSLILWWKSKLRKFLDGMSSLKC